MKRNTQLELPIKSKLLKKVDTISNQTRKKHQSMDMTTQEKYVKVKEKILNNSNKDKNLEKKSLLKNSRMSTEILKRNLNSEFASSSNNNTIKKPRLSSRLTKKDSIIKSSNTLIEHKNLTNKSFKTKIITSSFKSNALNSKLSNNNVKSSTILPNKHKQIRNKTYFNNNYNTINNGTITNDYQIRLEQEIKFKKQLLKERLERQNEKQKRLLQFSNNEKVKKIRENNNITKKDMCLTEPGMSYISSYSGWDYLSRIEERKYRLTEKLKELHKDMGISLMSRSNNNFSKISSFHNDTNKLNFNSISSIKSEVNNNSSINDNNNNNSKSKISGYYHINNKHNKTSSINYKTKLNLTNNITKPNTKLIANNNKSSVNHTNTISKVNNSYIIDTLNNTKKSKIVEDNKFSNTDKNKNLDKEEEKEKLSKPKQPLQRSQINKK